MRDDGAQAPYWVAVSSCTENVGLPRQMGVEQKAGGKTGLYPRQSGGLPAFFCPAVRASGTW